MGQVAIYCRVSTDDQSCSRQERDLRAFAKRAGHEIVAVLKETASGAKNDRPERNKVMALARARKIDAILVTELSRWGRSTQDLVQTLDDLHGWKVSVLAQTGLSFDLGTASGKLMRTIMAGLAEFERDLIRERVKSGLAAAQARGVKLGRQPGQRPSDKKARRVLEMHKDGLSYRLIGRNLGLSKNTVMDIVRRDTTSRGMQGGASRPQRAPERAPSDSPELRTIASILFQLGIRSCRLWSLVCAAGGVRCMIELPAHSTVETVAAGPATASRDARRKVGIRR